MQKKQWDVIVIGGGSAGLSAALMLGRARRTVLVLDGGSPRNRFAAHTHGVLGRDATSPLQLLADGRRELERYAVEVRSEAVEGATIEPGGFAVSTATGAIHEARRLIVTTGLGDSLPAVDGLAAQWGTGAASCPYCDGWEARDKRIGVLAAGAGGVHKAQLLRQWSSDVMLMTNGDAGPTGAEAEGLAARGIEVETRPLRRVLSDGGVLRGLETTDGAVIELDSIFLNPAPVAHDDVLRSLGADTAEQTFGTWVAVDPTGRTSVAGLWAAGNVVNPMANVPVAMAAGAMAGAAVNADLVTDDIAAAISELQSRPNGVLA